MEDCKYLIEEAGLILLRLFEFQSESSSSSSSSLELQLCRIACAKWNSSGSSSGQIPGATAEGLRGVYRGGEREGEGCQQGATQWQWFLFVRLMCSLRL